MKMTQKDVAQWHKLIEFRLNTFLRRFTRYEWMRDDLRQEAWIYFARCFEGFDKSKGSFKNYAYVAIDHAISGYATRYGCAISRSRHGHPFRKGSPEIGDFRTISTDGAVASSSAWLRGSEPNGAGSGRDRQNSFMELRTEEPSPHEILERKEAVAHLKEADLESDLNSRIYLDRVFDGDKTLSEWGRECPRVIGPDKSKPISREAVRLREKRGERNFKKFAADVLEGNDL